MDFEKMPEEKLIEKVLKDFLASESFYKTKHDQFLRYYKMYRSIADSKPDPRAKNRSNLFIPYTFSLIETVAPRITKAIVSNKPFLAVLPNKMESGTKATTIQTLLQFQLETKIPFTHVLSGWIKDILIYGTGITRDGWNYRTRNARVREVLPYINPETGELEEIPQEVEREVVVNDEPEVQNVDILDFYPEPYAKDIDTAGYVIHRIKMSREDLKRLVSTGYYDKSALTYLKKLDDDDKLSVDEQFGDVRKQDILGFGKGDENLKLEILEYWTNDHVVALLNREEIIKNEPNPYYHNQKPFCVAVDVPVSGEFYGIGEIENTQDLQLELNTVRNQRIDNLSVVINKMWKVNRNSDISANDLFVQPNGIIWVDDMDDLQVLEVPDITRQAQEEASIIQKDMDVATGVHDYARGSATDRRETATTANILTSSANERFDLKIILLSETGLKRLGRHLISLNQQYLESDVEVRVQTDDPTNYEFETVSLTDILGTVDDYDIIVTGTAVNSNLSKEARLDKLIAVYNVIKDEPLLNKPAVIREFFDLMGVRDSRRFLFENAEQTALMLTLQQFMGQQQQMMGDPQQPPPQQQGGF